MIVPIRAIVTYRRFLLMMVSTAAPSKAVSEGPKRNSNRRKKTLPLPMRRAKTSFFLILGCHKTRMLNNLNNDQSIRRQSVRSSLAANIFYYCLVLTHGSLLIITLSRRYKCEPTTASCHKIEEQWHPTYISDFASLRSNHNACYHTSSNQKNLTSSSSYWWHNPILPSRSHSQSKCVGEDSVLKSLSCEGVRWYEYVGTKAVSDNEVSYQSRWHSSCARKRVQWWWSIRSMPSITLNSASSFAGVGVFAGLESCGILCYGLWCWC